MAEADDAFGQAWNVPNAPDRTMRDILTLVAADLGRELKIQAMPKWMLSAVGLFDANARELKEMLYQWERPFHVDSSKFADRFWSDATSFEDGIAATVSSYPTS